LDEAQQLAGGVLPERVSALAVGERERISQASDAVVCDERRLEDECARQVPPRCCEASNGPDRPGPRVGVEDSREQGRAVVARQAEPIDRAVAVGERRGVAVGEQAIGAYRLRCAVDFGGRWL